MSYRIAIFIAILHASKIAIDCNICGTDTVTKEFKLTVQGEMKCLRQESTSTWTATWIFRGGSVAGAVFEKIQVKIQAKIQALGALTDRP